VGILTLALDWGKWSAWHSSCFILRSTPF